MPTEQPDEVRPLLESLRDTDSLPWMLLGSQAARIAAFGSADTDLLDKAAAALIAGFARAGCNVLADVPREAERQAIQLSGVRKDLAITELDERQPVEQLLAQLDPIGEPEPIRWVPRQPWPVVASPGRVVLLCGGTSYGKTTLGTQLGPQLDGPTLDIGADTPIGIFAERYLGTPLTKEQVHAFRDRKLTAEEIAGISMVFADGDPLPRVRFGAVARTMFSGVYGSIAAAARLGVNVVVDEILIAPDQYRELRALLTGLPTTWVKLEIDIETLRTREGGRGDRVPGMAEGQRRQLFTDFDADVVVDSGRMSPADMADLVLADLAN